MNKNHYHKRILISGGGIAGFTAAYWLQRHGFEPTVIEKAPAVRTEGHVIDFSGTGWTVSERMGIVPKLRERRQTMPYLIFKSSDNETITKLSVEAMSATFDHRYVPITRFDLQDILYQEIRDKVDICFDTTIAALEETAEGVKVTFNNGSTEQFDLVIGADGIHSQTRALLWGDEAQFTRYLGYYTGIYYVPSQPAYTAGFLNYAEPDRQIGVLEQNDGRGMVFIIFRTDDRGHVPAAERPEMIRHHYAGMGWMADELLAHLPAEGHFYFDSVTQVLLPTWSNGRVALIGDAACCLSLISGQGASMAMGGAYLMAQALADHPADYTAAFAAYEQRLRPHIEEKQNQAYRIAKAFVPSTKLGAKLNPYIMKLAFTPPFARFLGKQFGEDTVLN
ncbi:MAG: FAD-dependent monooxygenase [Anaerolineales bacterium]|nr:FAD-dependent monooxygenase [Anaerolineales bacterium]